MIREVTPGQSINTTIQQSAPGDTVKVKAGAYSGGVIMDRPGVTLLFEAGCKVSPPTVGSGRSIRIAASDIQVIGEGSPTQRVVFEDFGSGIGSTEVTGRNRVLLKGINQRRTNYGFWISGDDWTVEDFEVDRIMIRQQTGDADYGRMFGNRHKVRRGWLHGTQIPTDISPGHTDVFQFYNNSGANEVLKDCLLEEIVATDFVQGIFWKNETGVANAMVNNTIKNCVLFGTRGWPSTPNPGNIYHGAPSWGIYARGPQTGLILVNNTLVNCNNFFGFPNGTRAEVRKNICIAIGSKLGTVYTMEGTSIANINTGGTDDGNLLWNINWRGELTPANDITNIDPQITGLLGPSGDPFAADALWRPRNTAVVGKGAQISPTGGVVVPPIDPPVIPPATQYVTKVEFETYKADTNLMIHNLDNKIINQGNEITQLKNRVAAIELDYIAKSDVSITSIDNILRMP